MSAETLRELAEAATPGPWMWRGNVDHDEPRLTSRRMDVLAIGTADRSTTGLKADDVRSYANECGVDPDEAVEDWATDNYGEPIKEPRLWFYTDGLAVDARENVVYEVAPKATSRDAPGVYGADIVDIRHPDARYIAAANPAAVLALIDERDRARNLAVALEGQLAQVAALADEYDHRYEAGDHMVGCPDGSGYYDLIADEIRAVLETPDA